jgi:hypothetical protein
MAQSRLARNRGTVMSSKTLAFLLFLISLFMLQSEDIARPQQDINPGYRSVEAFLDDPIANFGKIRDCADVCNLLRSYELKYLTEGGVLRYSLLSELFIRHFQTVDEPKLNILFFLLLHCNSIDYSELTAREAIRLLDSDQTLFIRVLERYPEWKLILDKMSSDWELLQEAAKKLGASAFENEVRVYLAVLNDKIGQNKKDVRAFLEDPVSNFQRIASLNNICPYISIYDPWYSSDGKERGSILGAFFRDHFEDLDKRKIEILVFMMRHCGAGVQLELVVDKAAAAFGSKPRVFLEVLEKTDGWQEIIVELALADWLVISRGLAEMSDSQFARNVHEYLTKSGFPRRANRMKD